MTENDKKPHCQIIYYQFLKYIGQTYGANFDEYISKFGERINL